MTAKNEKSLTTTCQANNPATCRYHVALGEMVTAQKKGNFAGYLEARDKAEQRKNDKERKFFFNLVPDMEKRDRELSEFKLFARRSEKRSRLVHKSNTKSGTSVWSISCLTDETGAQCLECGKTLSMDSIHSTLEKDHVTCQNCGRKTYPGVDGLFLVQQALDNLDPQVTKNTVWYHASTNPNWHEDVQNQEIAPVIHAGTHLAAWMRMKNMDSQKPVYLYLIRIKDEAEVSELLYDDQDDSADKSTPNHPTNVEETKNGFETNKIMRYVNWWEEPGSVSIMATPSLLTVQSVQMMDMTLPYQQK